MLPSETRSPLARYAASARPGNGTLASAAAGDPVGNQYPRRAARPSPVAGPCAVAPAVGFVLPATNPRETSGTYGDTAERAPFAVAAPLARSAHASSRGRDRALPRLLRRGVHAPPPECSAFAALPRREPDGGRLPPFAPEREERLPSRERHRPEGRLRAVRRRRARRPSARPGVRGPARRRQRPRRWEPDRRADPAGPVARRRARGRSEDPGRRPVGRGHAARLERDPSRVVGQRGNDRAGERGRAPGSAAPAPARRLGPQVTERRS